MKRAPRVNRAAGGYEATRFEYFLCHAFKALVRGHAKELTGNGPDLDRAQLRQRIAIESLNTTRTLMAAMDAAAAPAAKARRAS